MKIRIKFAKQGNLRFIGHLDVMRYFQKMNRRADLDVKYSAGFSPHQEMSFATPLGLGLFSNAEYVDIEFVTVPKREELILRMNEASVPELRILDACLLPDDAKNAMSILAAADYRVRFCDVSDRKKVDDFFREFSAFYGRESIIVTKETKKNSVEVDLIPQIRKIERIGDDLFLQVDTGSHSNLKPELLLETFFREACGEEFDPYSVMIEREELYGEEDGRLLALSDYGTEF